LLIAWTSMTAATAQVTFRGLGVPNILLVDMSADGGVAVGLTVSIGEAPGIRWTAGGGAENIGGAMYAIAISRDGKGHTMRERAPKALRDNAGKRRDSPDSDGGHRQ
jgi:hypothetical protein